nr:MAG TPA: General transcription and DNA repair, DNA repair, helicase, multiprotein.7A [Caudoviricetes sp.]
MNEQEAMETLERLFSDSTNEDYPFTECFAEALTIALQALEKQIPKKPKHTYIKHGKHTWKKDENGETDDFAWEYDYHNGVVCEVCGETVCVHCNPDYDKLEDCEEDIYNCPFCNEEVCCYQKLCDCGQKLDWSDEE